MSRLTRALVIGSFLFIIGGTFAAGYNWVSEIVTGYEARLASLEHPESFLWENVDQAFRLENGLWCGTGWVARCQKVGAGYRILMVTARHVAEVGPDVPQHVLDQRQHPWIATSRDERLTGGTVLALHPQRDVAVLDFFSTEPVRVLPFAGYRPLYGELVAHSGYPSCDANLRTSQGLQCHDGVATFQASPGCSGGPVFRDDGTVIGILVSGLGNGFDTLTFTGMYVPVSVFEEWLLAHL